MNATLTIVGLLAIIALASGHSTGAPDQACETMIPGHGPAPQGGTSPYRVIMQKSDTSGEPVDILLTAPTSGPPFKGFFIEVREVGGDKPVGSFNPNSDPKLAQPVTCGGMPNVAMTHKDNEPKTQVKLVWTPPAGGSGEYQPMVTFVQQKDTFWVKEKSDKTIKLTRGASREKANSSEAESKKAGANSGDNSSSEGGSENGAASNLVPFFSGVFATSLVAVITYWRY